MTGKVFISSGTHLQEEKDAVRKVQELLEKKLNFTKPYLAIDVQSLGDIMNITKELRSSDYYLFIDFKRHSTFAHQELALAHHLGFDGNIIALQESGAELRGFMKYVQSNPAKFNSTDDLIKKVEELVSQKGWNPEYSRNLVVADPLKSSGLFLYGDHTGQSLQKAWVAQIENKRPDVAAVDAVCILDLIDGRPCADRSYLKWAGQGGGEGYRRTLLPQDFGEVALFSIYQDRLGLYLQSANDTVPRQPIVTANREYELTYKIFARDFPLLQFNVIVDLQLQPATPAVWTDTSSAKLKP